MGEEVFHGTAGIYGPKVLQVAFRQTSGALVEDIEQVEVCDECGFECTSSSECMDIQDGQRELAMKKLIEENEKLRLQVANYEKAFERMESRQ